MKMAFFYLSSAAAYFAHAIFAYSLIIYAQSRGGGASESGQLLATMYGPMLVLGLYGGMLADRYSRKTILLISHLLAGVVTAAFGFAISRGLGVGVGLFVFAGAYGIPVSVMAATRLAFVGNFAEPAAVERCTTIVKVMNVMAFGGGPLVAGWLRERVTWTQLFILPVALWSVSIALLLSLPETRGAVVARRASPWSELAQGFRFFRRSSILRGLALLSAAIFGLVLGPYQVLVPLLAKAELGLGEASRGLLMGAFGGGLLTGGILSAVATPFKRHQAYEDPDGYYFITGRTKEMINRGGEKVSPSEVERILKEHAGIAEAVVFPVPSASIGEEVGCALIVRPGVVLTSEDVRSFVSGKLAPYKIPRMIAFTAEIPKGPTGKYQRLTLAADLGMLGASATP